jgi:hypothetical protein
MKRELRIIDDIPDTPLLERKIVTEGTMEEVNAWATKNGLTWKSSRDLIFGGYWQDKQNGYVYMIT